MNQIKDKGLGFRGKMLISILIKNILNCDDCVRQDGLVWVSMTHLQMAEALDCVRSTAVNVVNFLCEIGLLMKAQLSARRTDRTMYYTVNPQFAENPDNARYLTPELKFYLCAPQSDRDGIKAAIEDLIETTKIGISMYRKKSLPDTKNRTIHSPEIGLSMIRKLDHDIYNNINKINLNKSNKSSKTTLVVKKKEEDLGEPKPKRTTARDALDIWNQEFGRNELLTKHISQFLVAAVRDRFNWSLEKWRSYLRRIKSSAYLMNGKFRVKLWWALKHETITQILNGEWRVQEPKPTSAEKVEAASSAVESHMAELKEEAECLEIRRQVRKKFGAVAYVCWMKGISLRKTADGVLVSGESTFVEDYAMQHFLYDFPECYVYRRSSVSGDLGWSSMLACS